MHLLLFLSIFAQANILDDLNGYDSDAPQPWREHRQVEQPRQTQQPRQVLPPVSEAVEPQRVPIQRAEEPKPLRTAPSVLAPTLPALRPPIPVITKAPPVVRAPVPSLAPVPPPIILPRAIVVPPTPPPAEVPRVLTLPSKPIETPRPQTLPTPPVASPPRAPVAQPIPLEDLPLPPPVDARPLPTVRITPPPETPKPRPLPKSTEIVVKPSTLPSDDDNAIVVTPLPRNPKPRSESPAPNETPAPRTFFRPGLGGYPFMRGPYNPVLGNTSTSFVFRISKSARDAQMFDRFLSEATTVCDPTNNPATGNIPCSLWTKGESFLIFESANVSTGIEKAYFQLISVPPRELVTFCDQQPADHPCISGRKAGTVYPHHGPQNPKSFMLYIDETKDESRILLSGKPFGTAATLSIVLDPIVQSEGLLMSTLTDAMKTPQIGMKIYYRGKLLAQGFAMKCAKENCGLMIVHHSTTPDSAVVPFKDSWFRAPSGPIGLP